ncbi:MAG: dephospho-CoA kinase [Verrucomicrobia bacterium]|nr:dephospho-CoA kinase [Verrucomicrobiota bacterium]
MKVFGLTGGIGMGKSAAAEILRRRGLPIVDSDVIARQIVEPGQPALAELKQAFGHDIVASDGRLRRDELARRVFANEAARHQLEAILHPAIRAIWLAQVERWRMEKIPIGVVVIPLLFETNATAHFDQTICVACSARTQIERLRARGWDDEQIQQRIHAQWPIEKKMLLADFAVWTEAELDVHAAQLARIIPTVEKQSGNSNLALPHRTSEV